MKKIENEIIKELVKTATSKKKEAYVPYSGFHVGAAVLTDKNEIVGGFNIENASYGATNCGERTAIFTALNRGAERFLAIAIAGDAKGLTYPCGICRQVMAEFMDPDAIVILAENEEKYEIFTLSQMLPGAFTKTDLESMKVK